ncbi:hypothetical protein IU491_30110, partial [Nocardia cyriacigeorgica]|uniref:hypothetical protein n=1 Tax=Nocardia cyriacigeorgica TaxID=135487 RepID=UPI0018948763
IRRKALGQSGFDRRQVDIALALGEQITDQLLSSTIYPDGPDGPEQRILPARALVDAGAVSISPNSIRWPRNFTWKSVRPR